MSRPSQIPHGTASCYQNNGCRRPECREANRAHNKAFRELRYADRELVDGRLVAFGDKVRHGTSTAFNYYGCRCEECAAGHNERVRAARFRKQRGVTS